MPNILHSRFYVDVQLTLDAGFSIGRFALTVGVNNLFNQDPPACFSCSLNNFDPTTYDVPGQFVYGRIVQDVAGASVPQNGAVGEPVALLRRPLELADCADVGAHQ